MRNWKKLKSKIVHKNPWYAVRKDSVIRPDGNQGEYYIVERGQSVAVIAEDKDNKIYLVGQTRYIFRHFSWEIVLGGVEGKETLLEGAKRELKEEAGLVADKWIKLGYFYPVDCYSNEKCFLYLARKLKKREKKPESTEDIRLKKEDLDNIILMIKDNKITDGMTITAIYKYILYNKKI